MTEEHTVKRSLLDSDFHIKYLQSYRAGMPDYDLILNSNLRLASHILLTARLTKATKVWWQFRDKVHALITYYMI
ncbi:hypothetical protein NQ317_002794 [Molorchus minor]|uniref:Uncharacterized protein n=1 Tax=Molorchus minor TaxID=1323400 RepID=A0ABQ9J806_9CUCU|nr:hypothetical protein NQ317_002794 [Molorchus minor]